MTERVEHTSGPWVVGDSGRMVMRDIPGMCDGHDGYAVAVTSAHSLLPVEEARANARLIAASPDLLSALQAVMSEWRHGYGLRCEDQVRAAISKATGEA